MRLTVLSFLVFAFLVMGGIVYADSYNSTKIAECIDDNYDAKVATETIKKYCICMDAKIPAGDARSVTEWEKSHPVEMAECDREAGWR